MKEYLQNILVSIAVMGLLYLLGAFIELSFNPIKWAIEARVIFGILGLILIMIASANALFKD